MIKAEQICFVKELSETIAAQIAHLIRQGAVPENWDGHELRVLLSDKHKASAAMSLLRKHPHGERNKTYNNWRAITPGG